MHIAFVTETCPPEINGAALTVACTVRHLRAAGHKVQLLRPRQRGVEPLLSVDEWLTSGVPIPMCPKLRMGWIGTAALRRQWRAAPPDVVHAATPGPLGWTALRVARAAAWPRAQTSAPTSTLTAITTGSA